MTGILPSLHSLASGTTLLERAFRMLTDNEFLQLLLDLVI